MGALACGGRIRVSDILEMLGEGVSIDDVLADFPIWNVRTFWPACNLPPAERILCASRHEIPGGCPTAAATGGLAAGLGDLPLFAAAAQPTEPERDGLREDLAALDVDALSPREALDLLYRLKAQATKP